MAAGSGPRAHLTTDPAGRRGNRHRHPGRCARAGPRAPATGRACPSRIPVGVGIHPTPEASQAHTHACDWPPCCWGVCTSLPGQLWPVQALRHAGSIPHHVTWSVALSPACARARVRWWRACTCRHAPCARVSCRAARPVAAWGNCAWSLSTAVVFPSAPSSRVIVAGAVSAAVPAVVVVPGATRRLCGRRDKKVVQDESNLEIQSLQVNITRIICCCCGGRPRRLSTGQRGFHRWLKEKTSGPGALAAGGIHCGCLIVVGGLASWQRALDTWMSKDKVTLGCGRFSWPSPRVRDPS